MPGTNRAAAGLKGNVGGLCIFISYRLSDGDVANAVANFLIQHDCDVYCSEQDARLKDAVASAKDDLTVAAIDTALRASTHLLGVISTRTQDRGGCPTNSASADTDTWPLRPYCSWMT
jgi:hypothetical protein